MNSVRGEVHCRVAGEVFTLCLTMGALAEIETRLGLSALSELEDRLTAPRAEDLLQVFAALIGGGGGRPEDEAFFRSLPLDLPGVSAGIRSAFDAAGLRGEADR